MNLKNLICSFSIVLITNLAVAQQDSVSVNDTTENLREVVITATRNATDLPSSPFAISVLHRKQMDELMFRSTPEALMAVSGVFVQKTNHGGGSPFVRGLTGNQTLILVDGIRLNNSTFRYGPNQYLNTIDPFTISRVEVVKGSGSVQFGSDAMGGVIHVLTSDPVYSSKPQIHGKAIGRYWNGDMEKTGRGELTYSNAKLAILGGVSAKNFGDLIGGDTTGRQLPSGYNEFDADLKLRFKISKTIEFIAAHQAARQYNVPVFHKVQLENFAVNEFELQKRNLSYIKLNSVLDHPFLKQISFTSSFQQTAEGRRSQKNSSTTLRLESDKIKTLNGSVDIFSIFTKKWSANTGLEYYHDQVNSAKTDINLADDSRKNSRGLYPDGALYKNASVYSLHHLQLNRFKIEAGLRYNGFHALVDDQTLGRIKLTPQALVVNAGISYNQGISHIYASFNSGYRAPNIDDMGTLGIVDFRYEIPSFSLKPETSYNSELGYKLSANNIAASVAFFHNRLYNLITRVKVENQMIDGYHVYKKENVENASIYGGESSLRWQLAPHWTFHGLLAYTYGKNISKNEPLRRIPPLNGRGSIKYSHKPFYLSTEFGFALKQDRLAQGDKEDNRIPAGGTSSWNVLNLYSGYQYKNMLLRVSGQNLLDQDYRTHGSGINSVGRSLLVSLEYSF